MPKKKQKVLIVDDIIRNIQLLAALLVKEGFEAVFATSGEGALEAVTEENPQLILLDINMPLMDGYEVCTRLKENPDTREIPVIFLTANVDEEKIIKGFEVGAVDYITKPFRAAELISRVNTHMRLQAALKAAEEANCRARAANRAKSQFLANMSHEIRTPMNAILGFSEILVDKVKDPKLLRYSKTIFSSGNALLRLINDILDLSKIEAGKFELQYTSVSVKEILNDMKFIFSGKTIKKGVDFKVELAENLPEYLLLDEVRLRQILINFIDNAIKFTDSGFIRLSVSCHDSAERRSCVGLEIDIEDSGIGIPLNQQKKIFGAFEQVIGQKTASYGCTGLGLSICLHLIEMMSGTVKLESIVGQGAHFTIQFPEVEISVAKPLKLGDLGDSAITFSPAKILIVDDIDYNRELLTSFMEDYVFEFCQARNGQEAIDKALLFKPDLILMDMKMPVMDGYESTRLMRQDSRFDDIRIVAVTASALKDDVEEIRKICDGYLAKPLKRQQLILELAKHLKHENVEKKLEKTADTVKYSLKEKREFLHFCQEKVSPLVVNLRESPGNFNTMREACDLLKGSLPVYQDDSFIKWQEGFLEACNSFDNERISKLCEAWSVVLKKLQ